jgi:hypothetical protein
LNRTSIALFNGCSGVHATLREADQPTYGAKASGRNQMADASNWSSAKPLIC